MELCTSRPFYLSDMWPKSWEMDSANIAPPKNTAEKQAHFSYIFFGRKRKLECRLNEICRKVSFWLGSFMKIVRINFWNFFLFSLWMRPLYRIEGMRSIYIHLYQFRQKIISFIYFCKSWEEFQQQNLKKKMSTPKNFRLLPLSIGH